MLTLFLLLTGLRPLWASVSPGKVERLDLAAIHKNSLKSLLKRPRPYSWVT